MTFYSLRKKEIMLYNIKNEKTRHMTNETKKPTKTIPTTASFFSYSVWVKLRNKSLYHRIYIL